MNLLWFFFCSNSANLNNINKTLSMLMKFLLVCVALLAESSHVNVIIQVCHCQAIPVQLMLAEVIDLRYIFTSRVRRIYFYRTRMFCQKNSHW